MTTAEPTRLIFYHDVYDPHSISMLFICRALLQRFNKSIQIQPMLVTNSSIQVYGPHSAQFNIKDATLQSKYYEIPLNLPLSTDHLYPHNSKQKNKLYQLSNSILCQYINIGLYQNDNATTVNTNTLQFLDTAINISNILWNSHISLSEKYDKLLTMNNVKLSTNQTTEIINYCLNDMRHYLSGNIYLPIRKQWFPRVDRLLFLLQKLNIKYVENERWNDVFTFKNPFIMNKTNILYGSSFNEILHVWVSFRSPYSWLIMNRLNEIVCKNKLKLKLYPVLPAIFRNVEISPNKGFYIGVIDCPRIAKYLNISYGPICDPAKDKNGKITFDEFVTMMNRIMSSLDKNGDGKITLEELTVMVKLHLMNL
eukprot:463953_1